MLFMRARRVVLTLVLVAPLVFVLSPRSKVESTSAPVLPPSITATKAVVDVLGTVDGNADPGDTLEYTITINNGAAPGAGNDATGVAVSDALQNIQTLVGGSLVVSPIAINDTYASIGNVGINVTDGASDLLGNDINPGGGGTLAIVAPVPTTSTQGGQVSINTTTGSFTYNPAPGFEGADTFVYTLGNGSGLTNTATVTINVSGMFWFVQTGAAAGGDGRLGTPFNCFVGTNCFDDTTLDQAADNIFLYTGAYTGGQTLLANQRLIGQGATIALAGPGSITGITIPPFSNTLPSTGGTRPTITTTVAATSAITLGSSNTLRGFNIGDTTAADITGTSFGTLTALEMDLNGTGRPLVLTTGTLAVAFDTLTSTSSTVGAAVSLTTVTGTLTAGSATLTGGVGGIGINGMSSGSVTITTVNINGQSGDGINITNLGSPASVSINGGTIGNTDDPAGNAVEVNGSNGNVTIAAALTKTTAAKIVLVTGRTGNTVAFSGNISATGAVDNGIDINNNTAGITNFTGQTQTLTTGANTAVNLFTNGTGSINFVPAAGGNGLDITTTSGLGFRAETGGTVTVQGAGNSITSTTGTPLSIVNATIGSPDVTFHDISKNGAGTGILLSSTAASGNLVVTGDNSAVTDGTNSSGGIIQNATVGISLINTLDPSFTNMHILTTTGSGVDGTDVTGFTFKNGRINSSGTVAVANTSNIAFNDVVSGINNIDGTVTITGNLLTNAAYHGVDILNESGTISNVTISNNTFTASGNDATTKGSGIHIDVNGSASTGAAITTGTVANNTINNFSSGAGIQFQGGNAAFGPAVTVGVPDGDNVGGGANLITITGNVIGNASIVGGIGTNGILAGVTGTGQGNYRITNNGTVAVPIQHFEGIGIAAFGGNRANVSHFISNNVIDATDNIFGSSGMSVGSQVGGNDATQNGTIKASITNNTINGMEGNGILAGCINSFNTGFFRIVGNTVGNPQAGVRPGIRVESGSSQGDTTVFLEISGNTSGGSTGHAGIGLRKQGSVSTTNEFHIEGLSPSPANHAQMETFVSGLNPGSLLGTGNGGGPSRVLSISGENYLSGNVPFALVAPRPKAEDAYSDSDKFAAANAPSNETNDASETASPILNDYKATTGLAVGQTLSRLGEAISQITNSVINGVPHGFAALSTVTEMISPTVHAQEPESGETVNVSAFTLPAGESVTVKFRATVDAAPFASDVDCITNTAAVTGTNFTQVNASIPSTIAAGCFQLDAEPDLIVTKTDGVGIGTTEPGEMIAYTLSYSNSGVANANGAPQHAGSVVLTETVPTNTTFNSGASTPGWGGVGCVNGAPAGTVCTLNVGAVNAGAAAANAIFTVNVPALLPVTAINVTNTSVIAENPALPTNGTDRDLTTNTSTDADNIIGNWDGSTSTDWNVAANWSNNVIPPAGNNISIPDVANAPAVTAVDVTVGILTLGDNLTIGAGRTVTATGDVALNDRLVTGAGTLDLGVDALLTRTTGQVEATLRKNFDQPDTFIYHVGTPNEYSPVDVVVTAGTGALSVRATDGIVPATPPLSANSLQRYWTLTGTGITANVTFHYLQSDVVGIEQFYRTVRVTGGTATILPNQPPCPPPGGQVCVSPTTNTIFVGGLTSFSDWSATQLAPTATGVVVGGRVVTNKGIGLGGVLMTLRDTDGNAVTTTTDAFGFYTFEDVPAGETYTLTPQLKLFVFTPQVIVVEDDTEVNFIGQSSIKRGR